MLKDFHSWAETQQQQEDALNELAPTDINLRGRLGQQSGGLRTMQRRVAQPLEGMSDRQRIVYLARFMANVYNRVPPDQREQTFLREFGYLKNQVLSAIRRAGKAAPEESEE